MTTEPATHKKTMQEISGHYRGKPFTVRLLEIGIRYHNNRYIPEVAYFVSVNGRGFRFTGKNALQRATEEYMQAALLIA